jgi:hypothetical protein
METLGNEDLQERINLALEKYDSESTIQEVGNHNLIDDIYNNICKKIPAVHIKRGEENEELKIIPDGRAILLIDPSNHIEYYQILDKENVREKLRDSLVVYEKDIEDIENNISEVREALNSLE